MRSGGNRSRLGFVLITQRTETEVAIQELIAKTGPKSRADIGRATGTTRATAGKAVARLLGFVCYPVVTGQTKKTMVHDACAVKEDVFLPLGFNKAVILFLVKPLNDSFLHWPILYIEAISKISFDPVSLLAPRFKPSKIR